VPWSWCRRHSAGLLAAGLAVLLFGCGEEPQRESGRAEPERWAAVERDPYAITCGDLADQFRSANMSLRATVRMAEEPELRSLVAQDTPQRVHQSLHYAMLELCRGQPAAFRPGRPAVDGVARGLYTSLMCTGPGCERRKREIERRRARALRLAERGQ
jgi:hypothetical protein